MTEIAERTTRYSKELADVMKRLGHATNVELLKELHRHYPDLSATTVHRITSRMVDRGELRLAPSGSRNILRFDANLIPHDHFMCEKCGILRDADIASLLRPQIEKAIGDGCSIAGNLTVSGICKNCKEES